MLSKTNIIRYSTVLIILAAGIFLSVSADWASKTKPTSEATPVVADTQDAVSDAVNVVASKTDVQTIASRIELNNYVLSTISSYEGGIYPYLLNNDYFNYNGVTENIFYQGFLVAKANSDGSKSSHCVGLTYEVFFKAMQHRNKDAGTSPDNFNNMNIDSMKDFLLTWYAAKGSPKAQGNQLAGAIVKYGLGTQITSLEDARAGDFIDFSRTKSGHTAVFINWLKDDKGNRVGFKYWSTQESTNGIGFKEEYFSDNIKEAFKGTVDKNQLYIGRVGSIEDYRPF
jgi:hypothetical protein